MVLNAMMEDGKIMFSMEMVTLLIAEELQEMENGQMEKELNGSAKLMEKE